MPSKHITYFEVLESFDEQGCPICNLISRSLRQRMEALLYEQVNDPETRRRVIESRGFCGSHSKLFIELGHPLGVALIYEDVIDAVANDLQANGKKHKGKCLACQWVDSDERRYLSVIAEHFEDQEMRNAVLQSRALCLPHSRALLQMLSPIQRPALREAVISQLADLKAELREIIRKSDYRCNEPFGSEGDAWIRTVCKLSGIRSPIK